MSVDQSVSAQIPAAPAAVRAFYVDLDNIATLHPLVVAVERIARTVDGDGYLARYRVRDRIPMGPLVLPISYVATLRVPVDGDVRTEARQFPRVLLRATVSFDAVTDGTRLTEELSISAPAPLLGVTVRQAVAAHTEMLAGIRRHFEEAEDAIP